MSSKASIEGRQRAPAGASTEPAPLSPLASALPSGARPPREALVCLVHGGPGSGKSSRVQSTLAGHGSLRVWSASCAGEHEPYNAARALIAACAEGLALVPRGRRRGLADGGLLARVFPELAALGRGDAVNTGPLDAAEKRRALFAALRQVLAAVAEAVPVALFVDDLDAADAESGALLADVLTGPDAPPVVCICAYRDDPEAPAVRVLRSGLERPGVPRWLDIDLGPGPGLDNGPGREPPSSDRPGEARTSTRRAEPGLPSDESEGVEALARVAAAAEERLAFERAADLWGRVEALATDDAARREARTRRGDALAAAGRCMDAAAAYRAAVALARTPHDRLALERRAAEQYLLGGHLGDAAELLREILASVGVSLPAGRLRAAVRALGRRTQLRLRGLAFTPSAPQAVDEEVRATLELFWSIAVGTILADDPIASYFHARHLLLALAVGEKHHVCRGLAFEGGVRSMLGEAGRRRGGTLLDRAEALAAELDDARCLGQVALGRSIAALYGGRWQEALDQGEGARRWLGRVGPGAVVHELTDLALSRLTALLYAGEVRTLRTHVAATMLWAEERGDCLGAMAMRTGHACIAWLAFDDRAGAMAAADRARAGWPEGSAHIHHDDMLARLYLALHDGDGERAHAVVTAAWPALEAAGLFRHRLIRVEALWARTLAALASAAEAADPRPCYRIARRAARRLGRERLPWASALAVLGAAGVECARGRRRAAARLLARAEHELHALGMPLFEAAARHRRGTLIEGAAGRGLVESATAELHRRGVASPARMVRMLVPPMIARAEADSFED